MSTAPAQRKIWKIGVSGVALMLFVSAVVVRPQPAHAQLGGVLPSGVVSSIAGSVAGCEAQGGISKIKDAIEDKLKDISGVAGSISGGVLGPQPVIDKANLAQNTKIANSASIQNDVTCVLNGLAWSVAKMTVQSITRSTVNWINSGFNGSPAFVSDLNENLSYLGDAVAEDFFDNLNQTAVNTTGFNIVSPFQDQIAQKLRAEYYLTTSNTLGLSRYDLNGHSSDPKAFINGDFSKGGFDAFFAASQNPANNPFGAYELASNALWGQINAAAQQRRAELDWGNGFLPWRGNCSTTAGTVSLSQSEQCLGSPVLTPGSVIESQLEQNLGTGVRQLELADSINEVVGALMGQLVNQVLGPGGLLGASQYSSGGGSSYINQATDGSQYDSMVTSLADGVVQNTQSNRADAVTYRDNWQKVLDASLAAQAQCGTRPEISAAITTATAGVQKGNAALTQVGTLQTKIQGVMQNGTGNRTMQISDIVSEYQSYLRSPVIPTPDEQVEAAYQSSATEDASGSETSLYTQMTELRGSCN